MQTQGRVDHYLANRNGQLGPNLEEDLAAYRLCSAMLYMVGLAPGTVRSVLDAYLPHGENFVRWDRKPK